MTITLFVYCVFMKMIKSSLKKRGTQSEKRKLKLKKTTSQRTSNSVKGFSKLKRTPLRRTRLSLQYSLNSSF